MSKKRLKQLSMGRIAWIGVEGELRAGQPDCVIQPKS